MLDSARPRTRRARTRRAVSAGRLFALAVAAVSVMAMAAAAVAATTTLGTATVRVSGKSKTVVVDSSGVTLYSLSGETTGHLKCQTRTCFTAWPPYEVSAAAKLTKARGVAGTLLRFHRVKGKFYQVTLGGHLLYRYSGDKGNKGSAKGEGITAFGGTWHVIAAG